MGHVGDGHEQDDEAKTKTPVPSNVGVIRFFSMRPTNVRQAPPRHSKRSFQMRQKRERD